MIKSNSSRQIFSIFKKIPNLSFFGIFEPKI
jgi:hypothetical protein